MVDGSWFYKDLESGEIEHRADCSTKHRWHRREERTIVAISGQLIGGSTTGRDLGTTRGSGARDPRQHIEKPGRRVPSESELVGPP